MAGFSKNNKNNYELITDITNGYSVTKLEYLLELLPATRNVGPAGDKVIGVWDSSRATHQVSVTVTVLKVNMTECGVPAISIEMLLYAQAQSNQGTELARSSQWRRRDMSWHWIRVGISTLPAHEDKSGWLFTLKTHLYTQITLIRSQIVQNIDSFTLYQPLFRQHLFSELV